MSTLLIPSSNILPNLIYSIGSRMEEKRGVHKNDLLFPEARTSSYCGGHCLGAALRSEHYTACFNDALSTGRRRRREGKNERRTEWEREGVGRGAWRWEDWAIFFPPTPFTPTPSLLPSLPSLVQKVHLSFHIHLERFF